MYNFQPKTLFVGKNIVFLPSCHSTNDIAAEMIHHSEHDVLEGTIIVTDHQTAGRGQRGNAWETSPGDNLTLSLILKPTFLSPSPQGTSGGQFELNLAVSLAVHDTFAEELDEALKIKWPNDVYVENRKMGGILIENTIQGAYLSHSVIGIGLNINQMSFEYAAATSLKKETKQPFRYDLEPILERLMGHLEKRYLQLKNGHSDWLQSDYFARLLGYRAAAFYRANGQVFVGEITGIDPHGRLLMQASGQVLTFGLKEVEFVL